MRRLFSATNSYPIITVTFQILIQVAGRSGRSELPGEVILQTFMPDHPIFKLASHQDYDSFYQTEIEERKLFGYPPFCHLIKLLFSSKSALDAENTAQMVYLELKKYSSELLQILPVIPSGHPKIKDLYRFQLLIKTKKISEATSLIATIKTPSHISMKVDVDPLSTFF
jgi:primosomal protein N' (replication factor Y)